MEGGELGGSGKPRSRPRLILKIHPHGFRFSSSSAFKVWRRDDQGCCKNNLSPSHNLQINVGAENLNGGGAKSKCSVCSKTFHSQKALHGHMRCHPDRDWRGANPPPFSSAPKTTHSSSFVVSSDIAPPPPPPPMWCKTGRRGQNCIINSASASFIITDSLHKKRKEENHRSDYSSKKLKIRAQDDAGHSSNQQSFLETRKYKCGTCHKVFPTLQDLVRNRSGDAYYVGTPAMGNSNNNMYVAASSRTAAHGDQEEGLPPLASIPRHVKQAQVQAVQKSHKCKICNKAFPTGQALGGHQTIHRQKLAEPEPATPQQESVLMLMFHEEAKQSEGPRVLDFDLNELPPVEEEQQQQNLCSIVLPLS